MQTRGNTHLTRLLLTAGVLTGPIFYAVAIFQMLIRKGFSIHHDAISVLSLGHLGWIQVANFAVTGILALLYAVGMKRTLRSGRGSVWGPLLIAIYGIGLILGSLFRPDPGFGFPPGAPAGPPTTMSSHAAIHSLGFYSAFLALVIACFIFARRFGAEGDKGWRTFSLAVGIISIVLIMLGSSITNAAGIIFAIAGAIAFGWASALAVKLRGQLTAN